jgi:uncharacterized protein
MSEKKIIRRLVLDVLKPYDPELNILTRKLIETFDLSCNITVYEMDRLTQKVKIILESEDSDLNYEKIQDVLNSMNCVVHSLDQVVGGQRIVEDIATPVD